jgi:flagellar assembly protein FliH
VTIMLCKVLTKDTHAAGLPPWLVRQPADANVNPAGQPGGSKKASAEVQELRGKVEELTALLDRGADAWEKGFRAGETAARKKLESEVREIVSKLAEKISEIAAQGPEAIRRAEGDTVRLAIEIARRVLHREISVDPSALAALVGAALEKLRNQEIHRVRIHPDLEKLLKSSLDQFGRSAAIEVLPDPTLPRGGVSFEIGRGSLDASVDTQLREIERGLADEIRTRS